MGSLENGYKVVGFVYLFHSFLASKEKLQGKQILLRAK